MAYGPSFGGTSLSGANGTEIEDIKDEVASKVDFSPYLLRSGRALSNSQTGGHRIDIEGVTSGANAATARTNIQAIGKAFVTGASGVLLVNDDRQIDAVCTRFSSTFSKGTAMRLYKWRASLESASPYWEATSDTTVTEAVDEADANPYSISVSNSGDVPVLSTIKVNNTGTVLTNANIKISNATDGRALLFSTVDLPASDGFLYDGETGNFRRISGSAYNSGQLVSIDGSAYYLQPGSNSLTFWSDFSGTWSVEVIHVYRPSFVTL